MVLQTNFVLTYSGKVIPLDTPELDPSLINILDIAYGLSNQKRFNGAMLEGGISVATHSIAVQRVVSRMEMKLIDAVVEYIRKVQLYALLHDAAEAYLGDIPSPVKAICPEYQALEKKFMRAIIKALHIGVVDDRLIEIVSKADHDVTVMEGRNFSLPNAHYWYGQKFMIDNPMYLYPQYLLEIEKDSHSNFLRTYSELIGRIYDNTSTASSPDEIRRVEHRR